ncbi:helix-turn-helix domain-containing protein [Methylobacterium sp. E-045]|uniref:helix-turn-helix domain-containing protein n=1 Tax=Methylobacterium sp. E-045 TaxID=2836575 RepID=UPI001FB9B008|nr:XRE family transcriptional regulator [Methylobacterium sp. E-045]MCJ2129193.1 LexA family transcriptional regulator [Methylobacterium sp. E-045]
MTASGIVPDMGKKPHPRNNLKKLREKQGWSQEDMATKLGMSKGGYVKVEDSDRGLKADRIAKAAEVLGVAPSEIIEGGDAVAPADGPAREPPPSQATPAGRGFSFKKVTGTLSAGIFKDVEIHGDELDEVVSAPPSTKYPWARQFAWCVEGDSMDQASPKPITDGDYVIGLSYEDIEGAVTLRSGLNVVVRQTLDNGQSYEETVKELVLNETTAEFHPRSSNPKHKPIIVKRDLTADDGRKVEIRALVQYVFDNHETEF